MTFKPTLTMDRIALYRFQLRCVLEQPIMVSRGQSISGELRLVAHSRQSYDVHLKLTGAVDHQSFNS